MWGFPAPPVIYNLSVNKAENIAEFYDFEGEGGNFQG